MLHKTWAFAVAVALAAAPVSSLLARLSKLNLGFGNFVPSGCR
jgi:hypothetical protein